MYLIPYSFILLTVVIFFMHISQIGDFGILVRSGFSVSKALFFNFLSALMALAGTALVNCLLTGLIIDIICFLPFLTLFLQMNLFDWCFVLSVMKGAKVM